MFTTVQASYAHRSSVTCYEYRETSLFSLQRFKLRFIFVPAVTPAERWKWKIIVTIKANGRRQDSERFAWPGNTEILITFLTSTHIFHIPIYRLPSSKFGNFLVTQNIVNISVFLGRSSSCWFMFLTRANSVLLSDNYQIKSNQLRGLTRASSGLSLTSL